MAKTLLNSALNAISGGIDKWVYRHVKDRTIIARRPTFTQPPSPAQLAVRERFRLAAEYATAVVADPVRLAPYEAVAEAFRLPVRQVIMTDYLNPPTIEIVDLSGYHGVVGDPIGVRAMDDVGVMSVHVAIRAAADNALLEQGDAMLTAGVWMYHATTARMAGEMVSIVATATDRPGNTGSKTEPWTY